MKDWKQMDIWNIKSEILKLQNYRERPKYYTSVRKENKPPEDIFLKTSQSSVLYFFLSSWYPCNKTKQIQYLKKQKHDSKKTFRIRRWYCWTRHLLPDVFASVWPTSTKDNNIKKRPPLFLPLVRVQCPLHWFWRHCVCSPCVLKQWLLCGHRTRRVLQLTIQIRKQNAWHREFSDASSSCRFVQYSAHNGGKSDNRGLGRTPSNVPKMNNKLTFWIIFKNYM